MRININIIFAAVLLYGTVLYGESTGTLQGSLYNKTTNEPVDGANIVLYSSADSNAVTGTVSDEDGRFRFSGLPFDNYFVKIQFIGYQSVTRSNIELSSHQTLVDLGDIALEATALKSKEVVVEGTHPPIEYRADRKIIDVSQFKTAESGFAVDVLRNVPSIDVDFEGNVSLRGSSNFIVQINGHPTVLDPQEALQQIPASSIKYIEVITNPSAKYGAEGGAGIINIILVEDNLAGSTGMLHTNGGLHDKYGGNGMYSYSRNRVTLRLGVNYNHHIFGGSQTRETTSLVNNVTSYLNSSGSTNRGFDGTGANLGLDYQLSSKDALNLGFRYGKRGFIQKSNLTFSSWNDTSAQSIYSNISRSNNTQIFYAGSASLIHKFNQNGHELSGDIFYSQDDGQGNSISQKFDNPSLIIGGEKTDQSGPSYRLRAKMDYTLPLSNVRKIEAGYQANITGSDETTAQYLFNPSTQIYEIQPKLSYGTNSYRDEQSLYSIYSDRWKRLSFSFGARGEYTYRNITHPDTSETFHLNRLEFFPSVSASYSLNDVQQLMVSYTRRIDRPSDFDLAPFQIWEDAHTIRTGNPSLKPEYIDSWELGFQTPLGKNYLNFDLYQRFQNNVIERINTVFSKDVTLETPYNVGTSQSFGAELSYRFSPLTFWEMNMSGTLRRYQIQGELNNQSFDRKNLNWNFQLNNTFTIKPSWQLQLSSRYRSASVTAQGRNGGDFTTDLAIKKNLFNNKLTASLQARNLFGTSRMESVTTNQNLTIRTSMTREAPIVMFSLRLNLGGFSSPERSRGFDGHPHHND